MLGKKVKDTLTGTIGTATARCEYVDQPAQVQIEWTTDDGHHNQLWFAETRLEVIEG